MKTSLLFLLCILSYCISAASKENKDPESPNPTPKKKAKQEPERSRNFAEFKKEPDTHAKNAWTTFATCLGSNNIFKQLMEDINSQIGTFGETCSIPVLREVWDTVRCGGYTVALQNWATDENMATALTNFQAKWQNDECTAAFVESNEAAIRAERRRRRLKKFKDSDEGSPTSTWGMSMSVGISVVKYQMSWSMGFIVNNCGCASWAEPWETYKRNPDLKEGEFNDESQRHGDVEFYCIDNAGKCWLPTADGQCTAPNSNICKNSGVTWVWGKSSTLGLGTDLIKTLGLSALGGGVSIGLTYDYDIPDMNCRFFPGTSLGASTSLSWGNPIVGLGGSLSLTVRVACPTNEPCGPQKVRYCGTSLGASFSTNANIAQLVLFIEDVVEEGFNKASEALDGPTLELDLTINLPLPDFLSLLTGGGPIKGTSKVACEVVAFSVGPEVYDAIGATSEYPYSSNGQWGCGERATTIPETLIVPHKAVRPFDIFTWLSDRNYWHAAPAEKNKSENKKKKISSSLHIGEMEHMLLLLFMLFLLFFTWISFGKASPQNEPLLSPAYQI